MLLAYHPLAALGKQGGRQCKTIYHILRIVYPNTPKLSDAYVKRQGYTFALFLGGGGRFEVTFFKNTKVEGTL